MLQSMTDLSSPSFLFIEKKTESLQSAAVSSLLPRAVVESPSPDVFKNIQMWHFWSWFSGGLGSIRVVVGLNLTGLFQPK